MSSSMRNFMEAYAAVHNTEAKEELTSSRDCISEMNLSDLTDADLDEIVEQVLEVMFSQGHTVDSAHEVFSEAFEESSIAGRQQKIERLCEALNRAFDVIDSKASTVALEEFAKYRNNKKLQESWSARFNQERRIQRAHDRLVAAESLNVKTQLLKLVEGVMSMDKDAHDTGGFRIPNNKAKEAKERVEKKTAQKMMKKMDPYKEEVETISEKGPAVGGKRPKGYLANRRKEIEAAQAKAAAANERPAANQGVNNEEVSQIRKSWGDAYRSIYEKKLDPVGQEDSDPNNNGKENDPSDKYIMKRRAAIGKAMGKDMKKEEVEDYTDFLIGEGYDCSELTWDDMYEEYASLDEGLRSAVKRLLGKKDAPAEKKPESRGEQLRKKYNVGPERSDTSAKMQILQKTRAKKERDQKEFGGSRYSKSVAKKSADAHDRYLRAGYSKYGADDPNRGKGNKAARRAAALRKEELEGVQFSEAELKAFEEIVNSWED